MLGSYDTGVAPRGHSHERVSKACDRVVAWYHMVLEASERCFHTHSITPQNLKQEENSIKLNVKERQHLKEMDSFD